MYIKKMYRELLLLIFYLISQAFCYKPVILLHGIMTGAESMELIKARIQEKHPGTIIYNIERFGGWSSLDNLNYQVQQISQDFNNFTLQHPGGIHLLGYSQGALLARTILQANLNHSVHTFISLSGPQAGQYGRPRAKALNQDYRQGFLHIPRKKNPEDCSPGSVEAMVTA
ncbi:lysosomal thioesterase PPT2 homolog isoform X2 [Anthonomus grandis grandis]|uniref:lysosomal thioesterase PPT2 homolog isoform X2 n=1 Tax=Anthonomus grandis grandis TaxID=2921223 RepID=UPI002166C0FD|nr:lysosomal thioesterase PPT2 homolog isoform X2 [Anthonomus grandis grandis]